MGYAPLVVNCCLLARTAGALLQALTNCRTADDQENEHYAAESQQTTT
jgi:hypothetical protein